MEIPQGILDYLNKTYSPDGIIVYGSFADETANENSDFDALLITQKTEKHDTSVVENILLDVFVYPLERFLADYDPEEFVQISDGKIILDKSGTALRLKEKVQETIDQTPKKSAEAVLEELVWCEKMLSRIHRDDAEGYFRWHWLLVDSLEIYCDIRGIRYLGPKKTLRRMEKTDADAFCVYSRALQEMTRDCCVQWISCLRQLIRTDPATKD